MNKSSLNYLICKLAIFIISVNCIGCASGINWIYKCETTPGYYNIIAPGEEVIIRIPLIMKGGAEFECNDPINHKIKVFASDYFVYKNVIPRTNYDNGNASNNFTSYCSVDYDDVTADWKESLDGVEAIPQSEFSVPYWNEKLSDSHSPTGSNCDCSRENDDINGDPGVCKTDAAFFFKVKLKEGVLNNLPESVKKLGIKILSTIPCYSDSLGDKYFGKDIYFPWDYKPIELKIMRGHRFDYLEIVT